METFPSTPAPSYDLPEDVSARTLEAGFGDGYEQRAGDGLNVLEKTWNVTWAAIATADCQTLVDFLEARAGHEAFLWTPARGPQIKVKCKSWHRLPVLNDATDPDNVVGVLDGLTATFECVPDLD